MGRCLEETRNNLNRAIDLYHLLEKTTQHHIYPLLDPKQHKHYVASYVRVTQALQTNPDAQIVYDMSGFPNQAYDGPASYMAMDTAIRELKAIFGERVLTVDECVEFLKRILPVRKNLQEVLQPGVLR